MAEIKLKAKYRERKFSKKCAYKARTGQKRPPGMMNSPGRAGYNWKVNVKGEKNAE